MGCTKSKSSSNYRRLYRTPNISNLIIYRNNNIGQFIPKRISLHDVRTVDSTISIESMVEISLLIEEEAIITAALIILTISARTIPLSVMELAECVICIDNNACVGFKPCNHLCLCEDCYIAFIKVNITCPLCRKKIDPTNPLIYDKLKD